LHLPNQATPAHYRDTAEGDSMDHDQWLEQPYQAALDEQDEREDDDGEAPDTWTEPPER